MMAIFIRHSESTGNVGVPCRDLAMIGLTEQDPEQIVAAANLERDNREAIERCRETAARTKKAVRCTIDVKARQDTRF